MIDCLKEGIFPTFDQIHEIDTSFRPLAKLHGCSIDTNDAFHTTKRWEKLQEKLKLVECTKGISLSPISNTKDSVGKHLSPTSIFAAHCEKWNTCIKVGGIHTSFIEACLQSCQTCQDAK